ncbi:uncharacterized protein HGUI_03681 [Hanseniaspora guilliermondii]|uniref:Uncharacterized protein n=1 Tax=Hanseniaspora guilliermondii TaxID=56406 RepID=A0A1L0B4M6_9ASCO|nr:uncharacterized protein HGUI_03681 [Hanseniaspora guilliermondii]
MNNLDQYKLKPPAHLYPIFPDKYPDINPFVHTNAKINDIYLNNFVNGYTNSDLLSKNPLNIKQQKDYKFTTNSNTNGNNTSTTSLGENEIGVKLFTDVNMEHLVSNMLKNLDDIKKCRIDLINKDTIHSTYLLENSDINQLNDMIFKDCSFLDNDVISIIMNNDIDWTTYSIDLINDIFNISDLNEFNKTFQKFWRFLKLIIFNFDKKLIIFDFINKWLLNYIECFEIILFDNNVKILNDKLPILQFIVVDLFIKIIPNNHFSFKNIDFIQIMSSILNLQDKYNDDLGIVNNILITLFNSRNLQNFKILDEDSIATEVNYQELNNRFDQWNKLVAYLQSNKTIIDYQKLDELIIWNHGIALKHLNILNITNMNDSNDNISIDHGITLSPNFMIILTKRYDHENILSHKILYLINNSEENFITLIKDYHIFDEETYWILVIFYFLKTKSSINIENLIILTNHLISLKLLNVSKFFLKLISSGILHTEYKEKIGHFLININYWNNNVKLYDTILSKYFVHIYDEYKTEMIKVKINSNDMFNNHLILTQQSIKYLMSLKSNYQVINCEDLNSVHDDFIHKFKYQYTHFWNYINFVLNNNLINEFKVFKLILSYLITYEPDATLFNIDFDVIFNYYMKLEQSMILQDVEYSNNNNMVLKYHFDGEIHIQRTLDNDYNIFDFAKIWSQLNSIYKNSTLEKLINYENLKHNTILNYNILFKNMPSSIESIKDEVNNHGVLQQFLIKSFRLYFNDSSLLVNIMIIKLRFTKTFNNFIPYFLKRLKLDSKDDMYLDKLVMLINDDVIDTSMLFNRVPIEDVISLLNKNNIIVQRKILNWIDTNQSISVKLLSSKLLSNTLKLLIIDKFYNPTIESYLANEKELLCELLGINYQQEYLSLNESNLIRLINNLNLNNYKLMKLLFNELINNLKINEILSILQSLDYDYILLNFLIIDFSSIEDYGNLLLNQLLTTILNIPSSLLLELINMNIKVNKKLIMKNFKISNDNIKIIINKLSLIKKAKDDSDNDLRSVFIIMLLFNIKDIKLNVNNNSKMSKPNQILASLINDKFNLCNEEENLDNKDPGFVDFNESLNIVRLRQNEL